MKPRIQAVEEHNYGVYVWYTEDGRRVEDDEGNVMNIPAMRGNLHAINKLGEAARHYGVPGGKAVFLPGRRQISQDEYDEQRARLDAGLIPDPLDYRALEDELRIDQTRND